MSTSAALAFYPLVVSHVDELTDDAVQIEIQVPDDLREQFSYRQGQYLTVRVPDDPEDRRRTYSLIDPPDAGRWRIGVRRIDEGYMSTRLTRASATHGTTLEVMPPDGLFTTELPDAAQTAPHWLCIAAGSGITPIMSIMRTLLGAHPTAQVTLLYGNRTARSIMFKDAIDDLKNDHMDRLTVMHFLSREKRTPDIFAGRITPEKLQALIVAGSIPEHFDQAFLCGPQEMVAEVTESLVQKGVDRKAIHKELFFTETQEQIQHTPDQPAQGTLATIRYQGLETEIVIEPGETILEAASEAGLAPPHSCTAGVCATCRAHLSDGCVQMRQNYALTDDEVEDGFILTCQSEPTTQTLTVDYDHR